MKLDKRGPTAPEGTGPCCQGSPTLFTLIDGEPVLDEEGASVWWRVGAHPHALSCARTAGCTAKCRGEPGGEVVRFSELGAQRGDRWIVRPVLETPSVARYAVRGDHGRRLSAEVGQSTTIRAKTVTVAPAVDPI